MHASTGARRLPGTLGLEMRTLLLVCTAMVALSASAQDGRGIGYPTVAAALEALRARSDVRISVQGGWTIVDDRSADTLWSFTASGHPLPDRRDC
jgi:hypothetical protein